MQNIKEGKAKISIDGNVFFNPKMQELRDISVMFLKTYDLRSATGIDCTAATGVRGIRYILEANLKEVTFLDINPKAFTNLKKNLKANKLKSIALNTSIQEFANTTHDKFDVVDLDPFGSPQPYIFDIMKLAKDGSLLMITTTDTAVLCGAHEPACYKIYNSKPLHNELCKEVGTRILINHIAKTAAQFNFGINVLLSISSQHYMRIFVDLRFGSKLAVASVKNTGFGGYCPGCHAFSMKAGLVPRLIPKCEYCKHELELFGPLWLGNLYDKSTTGKMLNKEDKMSDDAIKIMKTITNEFDTPLFYSIPRLTKSLGIGSVSHYEVIKRLKENGFEASPTQFDENGVKTNAKIAEVEKAIKAKA